MKHALLIGTSAGIGQAIARRLLADGWSVTGLSRSKSALDDPRYRHVVVDVRAPEYASLLVAALPEAGLDLCIYCAGIGELFDARHLDRETATIRVNLLGLFETIEQVLPRLLQAGRGTFAGLSSLADAMPGRLAPGYGASKAGMSFYLEGLADALRGRGVAIVNVRLGFVDTKMAKSRVKPFMLDADEAARRIVRAVQRAKPASRVNIPRRAALVMWLLARLAGIARVLCYLRRG